MEALVNDASRDIDVMKGCFADLKKAVSTNASDEMKKNCSDELAKAVSNYDAQMKTIKKNMPAPEGKSKAKPKNKGKPQQ